MTRSSARTPETSETSGDARPTFVIVGAGIGDLVFFRGELVRRLVQAGYRVIAVSPDEDAALIGAIEGLGAEHYRANLSRTGTNPLQDAKSVRQMVRWFRSVEPAAVFAHGAKPIVVGITAAWLLGIRRRYAMLPGLGYAFVDDGSRSFRRSLVRFSQVLAYRILFARCRAVIFHNEDDMRHMRKLSVVSEQQAWVVPGSGVDLAMFSASEAPVDPVRFLFVGRLLRSKGVMELAEAARLLRLEYPNAEVHLAGAVDENPEPVDENVLREHEANGDVVLHGHVADVRPLLREASVFVLPSYREGLPRAALEALASGRTLVVTDVPGCREVVEEGRFGELVPARDAASLAKAMIGYAGDPERIVREGREARRAAEERFDVHLVNAIMLEALEVT
ncbi:MAG: glycosyltransferase family 4 protein [Truepera sp.]|nr:glycosyltransferase family 4 protein [Truepera sp.]